MDMKSFLIVALVAALLVAQCSAVPRAFSTVQTQVKPEKATVPKGNTPSDHFKRIQKFAAAANNRNLLQHSELGSILLQANLPTSKGQQATGPITTINNRKMLQLV